MPDYTYDINIWIRRIINLAFYYINSVAFLIILIKRKPVLKELLITFILSLIPFTCLFFIDYPIILTLRYVFEYLVYFTLGLLFIKDKWYKILLETTVIIGIVMIYQLLTMLYKGININLSIDNFIVEKFLLIDFYILLTLTALKAIKEGGYIYGWRWSRILVLFSNNGSSRKDVQQNQRDLQERREISYTLGFKIFIVVLSVFQIVLVGTVCYFINNVVFEYIIICFSFFILRKVFGKSFHLNSVIKCTTLSILVFTTVTRISLPPYISIFCNVLLGCLVAYTMYVMYYYMKYTNSQGITIRRVMSVEEIRELSSTHNLTELEENILILFYNKREKLLKIAYKFGYSVDGINKIKASIIKKIRE